MKITAFKRIIYVYTTIGSVFGNWISPIITAILISFLRLFIGLGRLLDKIFFSKSINYKITNPIMIVGNPRSGTTFLHRYLVENGIGVGSQLWQLLYPSIVIQKLFKPILPILEKFSPTRHHSTVAHKTSLKSVETDDAGIFFRYLDGFFLYGFILSWNKEDLFSWVDPKIRDTSLRDYKWLESIWIRNQYTSKKKQTIGKLFSISANLPSFLNYFDQAKILYIVRDPLSVIPSGLSLVTGVLDKRFGFWTMPEPLRQRFIQRLYKALVELQLRFERDWREGSIDKEKVMIIKFSEIMENFDELMPRILKFINYYPSSKLINNIKETALKQKNFQSKHKYDLEKFGLSSEQILKDCEPIYKTFLSENVKAK
tara:strand:+ start:645 stop:1757 length:1113 start_codon:yes stop_codon:yes gene_type:complete